jgi:16S rRNA (uracil1498-N3)-methyltransferase
MKRFILNTAPDREGVVRLAGDDYHYLARVRRLAPGEFFPALLPTGEAVLVHIRSVENGVLTGECKAPAPQSGATPQSSAPPPPQDGVPPIILFQALPKGERMDLIVRQAAEGGVTEIVPFISEFSIPKIKDNLGAKKVSRWERIIKEARQQSGSAIATSVREPVTMDGLFLCWEELKQNRPGILGLLFHHLPLAQSALHEYLDKYPGAVALVIGPEGGFSPAEAERFLAAGFKPLTIGNTILRTETAALYAAAAIRIILLERNSWETKPRQFGNG